MEKGAGISYCAMCTLPLKLLWFVVVWPDPDWLFLPEGENTAKDLSLDNVPLTLKIARPRKLEEEAMRVSNDNQLYYQTLQKTFNFKL